MQAGRHACGSGWLALMLAPENKAKKGIAVVLSAIPLRVLAGAGGVGIASTKLIKKFKGNAKYSHNGS